jgi:hypothetical protein
METNLDTRGMSKQERTDYFIKVALYFAGELLENNYIPHEQETTND